MKYSVDELQEICLKHIKWINNDPEGEKADLSGANNAEYAQAQTYICPEGAVIGWKKALNPFGGYCIIKLPAYRKNQNARTRLAENAGQSLPMSLKL